MKRFCGGFVAFMTSWYDGIVIIVFFLFWGGCAFADSLFCSSFSIKFLPFFRFAVNELARGGGTVVAKEGI